METCVSYRNTSNYIFASNICKCRYYNYCEALFTWTCVPHYALLTGLGVLHTNVVQSAVCSVLSVVCSVYYAACKVCSLQCLVCIGQFSACIVLKGSKYSLVYWRSFTEDCRQMWGDKLAKTLCNICSRIAIYKRRVAMRKKARSFSQTKPIFDQIGTPN